MSEVFHYIFNNFEKIDKTMRKQSRSNRNFAIAIIGLSAVAVAQAKRLAELDGEIYKLKREMARKDEE